MGLSAAMRRALAWLVDRWDRLQVELHGQYSVERLHRAHQYSQHHSLLRVVLVVVLSPIPCLLLICALELIPLEPLSAGFTHSYNFRIRSAVVALFMAYTALEQYRQLIPALKTSSRQILVMSLVTVTGSVLGTTLIAPHMGFPIPFMMLVISPVYMICLMVCILVAWGKQLRQDKALSKELQSYQIVVSIMFLLTLVYPAYEYVFRSLDSYAQICLALLLPLIKLIAKNAISPFCAFIEDFKPEALIFNVEIFHALFVAVCMQGTTSMKTTLVLMAMDFGHSILSLRDVNVLVNRIVELRLKILEGSKKLRIDEISEAVAGSRPASHVDESDTAQKGAHIGQVIDHVLFLVKSYLSLLKNGRIRMRTREAAEKLHRQTTTNDKVALNAVAPAPAPTSGSPMVAPVVAVANSSEQQELRGPGADCSDPSRRVSRISSRQNPRLRRGSVGFDLNSITHSLSSQQQHILMTVLSDDEREEYVEHALQLLHLVEFMVLVEYTEVIIPIIYCAYLYLIVHLPNLQFYPQLMTLTPQTIIPAISSIGFYALLELLSFVVLQIHLSRKLRFSPLRLLGFVLEKQWRLVQLKLSTWLLFMLQISLVQFGTWTIFLVLLVVIPGGNDS